MHFQQHQRGTLSPAMNEGPIGPDYAQKNPSLRKLEEEANQVGSMMLRDFEDGVKYGSKFRAELSEVNSRRLMERFGYEILE